jgi:histidyl-tRNA synthetase
MSDLSSEPLSTNPYKGVRDFYPADFAVQQYIFDTWAQAAEQFGFVRYDASVLEPSALYTAKGAENAELANEQTYTFTDRGDRSVTLRPEMTPTVARMVAARRRELAFPLRWYSIPNLFRYERAQRGRLREHWQLNCDIFGPSDIMQDVEMIQLAHQIFTTFGATDDMFEILVNNRATMNHAYAALGILDANTVTAITRLNDRKEKISDSDYLAALQELVKDERLAHDIKSMIETSDPGDSQVVSLLRELGINNVRLDRSLARGFDYYTGTIFEIKDTHRDNRRSLLGGGRYDNLTGLFGGEPVSGIGFGLGDVTMLDFLKTHNLLGNIMKPKVLKLISEAPAYNLATLRIAEAFRAHGLNCVTDTSARAIDKKLNAALKDPVVLTFFKVDEEAMATNTFQFSLNTSKPNFIERWPIEKIAQHYSATLS